MLLAAGFTGGAQSAKGAQKSIPPWTENLFITTDIHYSFALMQLDELFTSYPGFHAGVGYTYKNWSFSLETGLQTLKGKPLSLSGISTTFDPFVENVSLIPLTVCASYTFRLYKWFSLEPKIGVGGLFSSSNHYETVLDLLTGKQSRTADSGFLLQAGLNANFSLLGDSLILFAGAAFDLLPENTLQAIGFPRVQVGFKLYPFKTASYAKKTKANKAASQSVREAQTAEATPEAQKQEEAPAEEESRITELPFYPIVLPDASRQVWTVFFSPNLSALDKKAMQTLDDFIAKIQGITYKRVYVRGYTAPIGTSQSQAEVADERVAVCAHYLESAGIKTAGFIKESLGSQKIPEGQIPQGMLAYYRSVQIIVE